MKRVLRLVPFFALAVMCMGAAVHPTPHVPGTIETYKFRDGAWPDSLYNGMTMAQMRESDAITGTARPNWTAVAIGDTVDGGNAAHAFLWKADISALPDDFIVFKATLRFLASTYLATDSFLLSGYRVMRNWGSSATWYHRGLGGGTDSTWSTNGARDVVGSVSWRGTSVAAFSSMRGKIPVSTFAQHTKAEGSPVGAVDEEKYSTAVGLDSVWTGYTTQVFDTGREVVASTGVVSGSDFPNDSLWIEIDVTLPVQRWHEGRWANFGLMFRNLTNASLDDDFTGATSGRLRVITDQYPDLVANRKGNWVHRRPSLIVTGVYAVADTVTADTVRIGLGRKSTGWGGF